MLCVLDSVSGKLYRVVYSLNIARILFSGKSDGKFSERCFKERIVKIMSRIKLDGVLGNDALMNG